MARSPHNQWKTIRLQSSSRTSLNQLKSVLDKRMRLVKCSQVAAKSDEKKYDVRKKNATLLLIIEEDDESMK